VNNCREKREKIRREKRESEEKRKSSMSIFVSVVNKEWRVEARGQVLGQEEKRKGTWSYRYSDAGREQVKKKIDAMCQRRPTTLEALLL